MAKTGDISKKLLTEAILNLYPKTSFIDGKNIYINFRENNEDIQLKISIAMPKTLVEGGPRPNPVATADGGIDFDNFTPKQTNVEFTQQEIDTIEAILSKI